MDETAILRRRNNVLQFERAAIRQGYCRIAGIDEAGRGALSGPVVAAAVILKPDDFIEQVDDSKKLTPRQRDVCFERIRARCIAMGIGLCRSVEIDRINILNATKKAMIRAVNKLKIKPDMLLIDAVSIDLQDIPIQSIIKGDQRSHSIAAASIMAKVIRDRIMNYWHRQYPEYGFLKNKGYGTLEHREAIRRWGPCPVHRMTFKGVYDAPILFND